MTNKNIAPRFEIISWDEKGPELINKVGVNDFDDFWAAVQICIEIDKQTEEDIRVACYQQGELNLIIKPEKEKEGLRLKSIKI